MFRCGDGCNSRFRKWPQNYHAGSLGSFCAIRTASPVFGGIDKFQTDPHWSDLILFHEYFDGDTGSGVGASHQSGWTALVGKQIQ
jgi:hypothetical protein